MNKLQEDQVFRELSALRIENQELKRLCDMDKVQRIQELEETIECMNQDALGISARAAGIFSSPASTPTTTIQPRK